MREEIKNEINNYKCEHEYIELEMPLILIAEVLVGIQEELENITNKMYE